MGKGLFITGTNTDVGKTYVTALIVKNCGRTIGTQDILKPRSAGIYGQRKGSSPVMLNMWTASHRLVEM